MIEDLRKDQSPEDFGREAMRRTVEIIRERERLFPHSHSFIVELATPQEEAQLQRAEAWLAAGNVARENWCGSSDPAGFTYAVHFKNKEDFERFQREVLSDPA